MPYNISPLIYFMKISKFIYIAANGIISLFSMTNIHCTYVPHLLYSFLCQENISCNLKNTPPQKHTPNISK